MDRRLLEFQYKLKIKMWRQNLEQRTQELKEKQEVQKEKYNAWTLTLREEFKISIKENAQVETVDKLREWQPKDIRKQTLSG